MSWLTVVSVVSAIAAGACLFLLAGITGLLFTIWPTSWPDHELNVTAKTISALDGLERQPKFSPDTRSGYVQNNEALRVALEEVVNASIQKIKAEVRSRPRKSFVLAHIKSNLARLDRLDTEEKDRILGYYAQTLDILGIESSNYLFEVWRYGFPYGSALKASPHSP